MGNLPKVKDAVLASCEESGDALLTVKHNVDRANPIVIAAFLGNGGSLSLTVSATRALARKLNSFADQVEQLER